MILSSQVFVVTYAVKLRHWNVFVMEEKDENLS